MNSEGAVSKVLAHGLMFDAKAFELIKELPDGVDSEVLVEELLRQKESDALKIITEGDVRRLLPDGAPDVEKGIPAAAAIPSELDVLSDPTKGVAPSSANDGYRELFRDRYVRLLAMVRARPDTKGVVSVSAVRALAQGKKAKVAALLSSRVDRRSGVDMTIDDPTGTVRLACQDEGALKAAREAPLDSMVVVDVARSKSGRLYADAVTPPDVADRRPVASSHRVYAVLLSDLHIGSRMFLDGDFRRFVQWLNGRMGDEDMVSRIKYVIIAGDVIDGVGVYPGQELQLSERDPKKQYAMAAKLLSGVPPHIQIVVAPGNHDPVRQALPQPAVPADLAEALYGMNNVRWVGDPAYIKIHGVSVLMYHGKSLDDVIATTPGLEYTKPTEAMKLLLRSRHLAPTYGKRTALSPELRDFMVIDQVPDILHCGHVHAFGELNYRGTLLVNSGTWQAQTSFQANMGLEPTPSIVPVIDLSTLRVIRRNFGAAGFAN